METNVADLVNMCGGTETKVFIPKDPDTSKPTVLNIHDAR